MSNEQGDSSGVILVYSMKCERKYKCPVFPITVTNKR